LPIEKLVAGPAGVPVRRRASRLRNCLIASASPRGGGIRECVALGFVEVTVQGRAGNAEFRQPNMFRLTYVFTKDTAATNEWRAIETTEGAKALAVAARKASTPCKPARARKLQAVQ
jgi:hypothetical protein